MTELGGTVPAFDGLIDSAQPKDTEVVILEEDSLATSSKKKRSRQGTAGGSLTLQAHWVVLWSLSPYFRAKVRKGAPLTLLTLLKLYLNAVVDDCSM
jgi:hypothetical protein